MRRFDKGEVQEQFDEVVRRLKEAELFFVPFRGPTLYEAPHREAQMHRPPAVKSRE